MDYIIEFIHKCMPVLYVLAFIALFLKIILTVSNKGFDIAAFLVSFFRVYDSRERELTTNKKRKQYMVFNNYINYYIYFFILIFIMLLIIYQKNMFTYS